jgi:hypothetical protein
MMGWEEDEQARHLQSCALGSFSRPGVQARHRRGRSSSQRTHGFASLPTIMSRPGQGVPSVLVRFGFGCLDYY